MELENDRIATPCESSCQRVGIREELGPIEGDDRFWTLGAARQG